MRTPNLEARLLVAFLASACAASPGERAPSSEPPEGAPAPASTAALRVLSTVPPDEVYLRSYGTNPTVDTSEQSLSSFAVDTDRASYSFARGRLRSGRLPEEAAVRVEEFVNAFDYGYATPEAGPLSLRIEVFPSPFRPGYHVLALGLQARRVLRTDRAPTQLVLVLDLSKSMGIDGRLETVKAALRLLLDELRPQDAVAIVGFAERADVLSPLCPVEDAEAIRARIDRLLPRGETDLGHGLSLAYELAQNHPAPGNRRLLLFSDGVADRGLREAREILEQVGRQRRRGVSLSTVGVGARHYDDVMLEQLADAGDGEYVYLDGSEERRRVFGSQLMRTLETVAKDVKVQLELDPEAVTRFRLLGYENRELAHHEVHDDRIDGGEMGAGASVTALYEIRLSGADRALGQLRVRYVDPSVGTTSLLLVPIDRELVTHRFEDASSGAALATFVAGFAEKLRGSYWARVIRYETLLDGIRRLPDPVRKAPSTLELLQLIEAARRLDQRADRFESASPIATMSFDEVPISR